MLDLLRSDPKTSEEEHFKLQLVSTEVERVKYLVRSYLRCRLDKVRTSSDVSIAAIEVYTNPSSNVVCLGGTVFSSYHTHTRRALTPIRTGADTCKAVRTRYDFDISYKLLIAGLRPRRYTALLHQHFSSSVLNSLPEWLRRMDDVGNDGLSMGKRSSVNRLELVTNAQGLTQCDNQIKIYQF